MGNKEFIIEALKYNKCSLHYASDDLKNDQKFVLDLVKKEGYSLFFISEKLQKNKKINIAALKSFGFIDFNQIMFHATLKSVFPIRSFEKMLLSL